LSLIHPSAYIHTKAELGSNVCVGAYAVIGEYVRIGDNTSVSHHAIIDAWTTIGCNNQIYPFVTLGSIPQDLKYRGEAARLVIGNNNKIREYVNISIGTNSEGLTKIGHDNLFMVHSHVAHDCQIGNRCILANCVALGGHVKLQDYCVLGGLSAVHQFCRMGDYSMLAGGVMARKDIPPYVLVQEESPHVRCLNLVGLKRAHILPEKIRDIKTMFSIIYEKKLLLDDALVLLRKTVPPSIYRDKFLRFLETSQRGIYR